MENFQKILDLLHQANDVLNEELDVCKPDSPDEAKLLAIRTMLGFVRYETKKIGLKKGYLLKY